MAHPSNRGERRAVAKAKTTQRHQRQYRGSELNKSGAKSPASVS